MRAVQTEFGRVFKKIMTEENQKLMFSLLLLSWRLTSPETVWLIGDGGRMEQGMKTQAHLSVHTAL